MSRRDWKRIQPTSLRHALELCKDYAKERHNLSVERIAERMGLTDHWTVYKWIQTGRIPANMIRPYPWPWLRGMPGMAASVPFTRRHVVTWGFRAPRC